VTQTSNAQITHADSTGAAHMVDISDKTATLRCAVAEARVCLGEAAQAALQAHLPKGDAFAVARIAGIQAAKRTWELIPLCHNIPLSKCTVQLEQHAWGVRIRAEVTTRAPTGVEMEALTAASVAALTLYDMLKATEQGISIEQVHLVKKTGGKHNF
jgi:cyclic pyranopterin phosphate synthase